MNSLEVLDTKMRSCWTRSATFVLLSFPLMNPLILLLLWQWMSLWHILFSFPVLSILGLLFAWKYSRSTVCTTLGSFLSRCSNGSEHIFDSTCTLSSSFHYSFTCFDSSTGNYGKERLLQLPDAWWYLRNSLMVSQGISQDKLVKRRGLLQIRGILVLSFLIKSCSPSLLLHASPFIFMSSSSFRSACCRSIILGVVSSRCRLYR